MLSWWPFPSGSDVDLRPGKVGGFEEVGEVGASFVCSSVGISLKGGVYLVAKSIESPGGSIESNRGLSAIISMCIIFGFKNRFVSRGRN